MTHPPQALDRASLDAAAKCCDETRQFWDGSPVGHVIAKLADRIRSLAPPAAEKRWPSCFDCGHLFKDDEARFAKGRFHVCRGCFNVSESQPPAAEKQSEPIPPQCDECADHHPANEPCPWPKIRFKPPAAEAKTSEKPCPVRDCPIPNRKHAHWSADQADTLDLGDNDSYIGGAPSPASDGGSDEEIGRHLDEFVHLNKRVDGTHAVPDGFYGALAREARSLLGVDALRAERDEANRQRDHWCSLLDRTRDERDTLRAEVEKLKAERDELRAQRKILFNTLQQCSGKSRRFREYVVESLNKVEARISGIAREEGQG